MVIYPKGKTEKTKNYVGLYLVSRNDEIVDVDGSFYLANFSKWNSFKGVLTTDADGDVGVKSFVTRSELARRKSTLVKDGKLDIHCTFKFSVRSEAKPKIELKPHAPEPLRDSLHRLLTDTSLSDTTINCGNEEIRCHKSILANRFDTTLTFEGFST